MKGTRFLLFPFVALLPVAAFATGVTSSTGTSAANTALVSITIPAVIAIDVESNVTFDFNTYAAATGPTDCTNKFPPGADCTTATYTPSTVTEPASGVSPNIWLAVFSTNTGRQATMTVTAHGDAAFSSDPGFTPQKIRVKRASLNNNAVNGATFGPASSTFIGTSVTPLDLKSGTMTSSVFAWTRIDQTPDLAVPGTTSFNAVTGSVANITFTLKY